MNYQTGRNHLPLAALCLVILLLGTQRSPAPISPLILVTPVPTNGIAALPVQFNAASVAQPGSHVITNWVWNFGDGSAIVTNPAPAHVYVQPGTFNVLLLGNGSDGGIYGGTESSPLITPINITATGAVFTVRGVITLTGVPAGFTIINGVLLAEAGSVAGQTVPVFAPVKLTANGGGSWAFSVSLNVPLTRNANATYSLSAFPGNPIFPNSQVMVEYNDGAGHTGVLIGNLGVLASQ